MEQGADGIELDVQLSSDGVPVVIHDATLDRTTGGRGRVDRHSWKELRSVRVGGEEPLPSLDAVARWAADSGAFLNVELKATGVEKAVLDVLHRHGLFDQSFISAFDPGSVSNVGMLAPHARRFLLCERWDAAARENAATSGAEGICLRDDAASTAAMVEISESGLPLVVWTVDDTERMRTLLQADVFALITNRPAEGAEVRASIIGG